MRAERQGLKRAVEYQIMPVRVGINNTSEISAKIAFAEGDIVHLSTACVSARREKNNERSPFYRDSLAGRDESEKISIAKCAGISISSIRR